MNIQNAYKFVLARIKASGSGGITYLLKALFTADNQSFSDAQVLDTEAEGVTTGSLTVVDAEGSLIGITSNKCSFLAAATPDYADLGLYSQAITRSLGLTIFTTVNVDAATTAVIPLAVKSTESTDLDAGTEHLIAFTTSGEIRLYRDASNYIDNIGAYVASTDYELAFVLGGFDINGVPYKSGDTVADFLYGVRLFVKGGAYTNWTLLWMEDNNNTATLYAAFSNYNAAGTLDNLLIPDYDFSAVLQPTVLDTFTGTNGDDLGTHAMDVDPDGNDWSEQVGSWEIQSNKGVTTGGAGIADFDAGIADIVLTAQITFPASGTTPGGIILRAGDYTGSSEDFWYIKCTPGTAGNDFEIIEYVAGTPTSRAAGDADFTAGATSTITVIAEGTTITAFANGADKITYASASSGQALTRHGIRDEGTANMAFDSIAIHPRTSATYETTFAAGTLEL